MNGHRYLAAFLALVVAIGLNLAALYLHTNAQATMNHAGLVVQYRDGRTVTRCVSFSEPEITGYDLLRRANLQLIADAASGGTICKIGDTGCSFPAQQCFCECQDLNQSCVYWIYYFQVNNAWKYASLGSFTQKVTDGSVNGWIYGAGSASSSVLLPPLLSLDQICSPATATALPSVNTPLVTATAAPTLVPTTATLATRTPVAAASATRSMVSTPTVTAMATPTTLMPTPTPSPQPINTPPATITAIQAIAVNNPTPAATVENAPSNVTSNGSYAIFAGLAMILVIGLVVAQRSVSRNRS